jgi:hypothetical protein
MSVEAKRTFIVTCNSCGTQACNPDNRSSLEARVSAGILGWGWREGRGNSKNLRLRSPIDWCPACTEALALKATQEVTP